MLGDSDSELEARAAASSSIDIVFAGLDDKLTDKFIVPIVGSKDGYALPRIEEHLLQ